MTKFDTYHTRTIESLEDEMGAGRYAKQSRTVITGTGSEPVLAVPQWSRDHGSLPPEPPTGECIDATPDLGFPAAPAAPTPSPVAPSDAGVVERGAPPRREFNLERKVR